MIRKFICNLGFHSIRIEDKWMPSINAQIVTKYDRTHTCVHCGKVTNRVTLVWNGKDMVKVNA